MKYLLLILKGMAYGVTHIVPGLGGGLILILMGIYEEFVATIGNFFVDLKHWKQHLAFLVPLGFGMVIGMLAFARLIDIVLDHYPAATMVFFMGLLLGTIPSVLKLHKDMSFSVGRGASLVLGLALVVVLSQVQPNDGKMLTTDTLSTARGLGYNSLICFLAGGASVTPGLDGSYVLLLGGVFAPVIEAVSALTHLEIHWGILATTGLFAALGILLFSKAIDTAIKRAPSLSYYFVLGLILGSVYGLWPQQPPQVGWFGLAIAFVVGFGLALLFGRSPEAQA